MTSRVPVLFVVRGCWLPEGSLYLESLPGNLFGQCLFSVCLPTLSTQWWQPQGWVFLCKSLVNWQIMQTFNYCLYRWCSKVKVNLFHCFPKNSCCFHVILNICYRRHPKDEGQFVCLSTPGRGGGVTPSPSHNTSNGPMSFPGGNPISIP